MTYATIQINIRIFTKRYTSPKLLIAFIFYRTGPEINMFANAYLS